MEETKSKIRLADKVHEMLSQYPEEKFTRDKIAEWIFKHYPDECKEKLETTRVETEADLLIQIAGEIHPKRLRFDKCHPEIKTIKRGDNRLLLYFTERDDSDEVERAEDYGTPSNSDTNDTAIKEKDLYPILSKFLQSGLQVYSKRIDEKKSSNTHGRQGNRWLHPDLAGMEDLSDEWHGEIKNCVKEYADKKAKLWSFEVKLLLNRSNVREAFFQAVSNSSWANFGYLVASEVGGEDTLKELRILSGLHGIGFIQLNVGDPAESQIMIPAKERTEIDWDTANRLAKENSDFLEYIKLVHDFCQGSGIRSYSWDTNPHQD